MQGKVENMFIYMLRIGLVFTNLIFVCLLSAYAGYHFFHDMPLHGVFDLLFALLNATSAATLVHTND